MSHHTPAWKRPMQVISARRRRRREARLDPAPFIVGVNRSGTTLLRLMLDSHPELTIPPETHFVPELIRLSRRELATRQRLVRTMTRHPRWDDFGLDTKTLRRRLHAGPIQSGTVIRAFYELYAETQGKPRWGDKTPRYMRAMPRIQKALPEVRFVHIIRDGRDVALSQNERALDGNADSIADVAARWRRRINTARVHATELRPDSYREVRYEDLVTDPAKTLQGICEFISLPYDDSMLRYYERAADRLTEMDRDLGGRPSNGEAPIREAKERMAGHAMTLKPPSTERCGRWRDEMSAEDAAEFERVAGDLLSELGYELRSPGTGEQTTVPTPVEEQA